jgi:serine/threonine protein kinase
VFLAHRRGQRVPKVLDFGISKTSKADSLKLTRAETLLGTPHYMSPEQAQGANQADARSDQFALGVILYECVTGQCPFEGSSLFAVLAAIVGGTLTPPSRLVPALDPSFDAIVTRALSKEPDERYADVRALGAALLPLASPRVQLGYAHEFSACPVLEHSRLDADSERPSAPERLSDHRITVASAYREALESAEEMSSEPPASLELLTIGVSRRSLGVASVLLGSSLVLAAIASVALAGADDSSAKAPPPTRTAEPFVNGPSEVVVPPADVVEQRADAKSAVADHISVTAVSAHPEAAESGDAAETTSAH